MSYTVTWDRDAEAELAACWLTARDRQRLAEACQRIDEIPTTAPETGGESRELRRRVMFVDPLWVWFEIDAGRRRVLVSGIWRYDG